MTYPRIDLGNGHYCYSGPNCKKHGGKALQGISTLEREQFIADVVQQEREIVTEPTITYAIPFHRVEAAIAQVEKANKKLSRYSEIAERYEWHLSEPRVIQQSGGSYMVQDLTVTKPVLKVNGWSFAAAHEFTANGDVTSFVADKEVTDQLGKAPVDNHCDYCGSNRARERVYWLKGETGEVKQVGSTCLKGFLGVSPQGLWALESDLDLKSFGGGGSPDNRVFDREALIVAALAASKDGEEFVPRARADRYTPATGDLVLEHWEEYSNVEFSPERIGQARNILMWLDSEESQAGDYMGNLKAALGSGAWVKPKHVSLAVSAISAYRRHLEHQTSAAQRAQQNPSYLAAKGVKLKNLKLKVTKSKFIENGFGGVTLLTMEDDEGHVVKWFASSASYRAGDEILVTSATVKGNEQYEGQYQTVLTRARTEKV